MNYVDYSVFDVGSYAVDVYCWQVTTASLWSVRVVVLVKQEHRNKISHVQQSSVKTGIANTLGDCTLILSVHSQP